MSMKATVRSLASMVSLGMDPATIPQKRQSDSAIARRRLSHEMRTARPKAGRSRGTWSRLSDGRRRRDCDRRAVARDLEAVEGSTLLGLLALLLASDLADRRIDRRAQHDAGRRRIRVRR